MCDRRLGHHAMTEVEDKRSFAESVEDGIDAPIQSLTTGKQCQRIEVALNRAPGLHMVTRERQFHHPVKSDRIHRNSCKILLEPCSGPSGKTDDSRRWNSTAHLRDDS